MASGRVALGDAKSGRDVNPTLRSDSRLAFRRPGHQTHGAHRTQGIIFADGFGSAGLVPLIGKASVSNITVLLGFAVIPKALAMAH